ncbi:MAG: ATP-binding protein [Saprospiraceae bacterium]|nr:ATP-binding protein [Saprospiraceae bacterium]
MLRNFKIKASLYLLLILGICILIPIAYRSTYTQNIIALLIPIGLVLARLLFKEIDKTNAQIRRFLDNIKYDDFEAHFSESNQLSSSQRELHHSFNLIIDKFRDIRSEKEAQFQYLQAIVENVDTGLICFNAEGKNVLINKGLQQFLHKSYFPNFESIQKFNEPLYQALNEIVPGERKLVRLVVNHQLIQLAIRKTILHLKEDSLHLFAIQNIHAELEEQEVVSWQKLIRILTHEIMNSITPVISLSATTKELLEEEQLTEEDEADIKQAIQAIHRRSTGLLNFTQSYRQLTKIPPPSLEEVNIFELVEHVLTLLKNDLQKRKINVNKIFKEKAHLAQLDPDLMEQVLINLLKNAVEAMNNTVDPTIQISVLKNIDSILEIQISDNGPGISPKLLDKIFIPFFTTKSEGSGIGLSLSRQIIQMHKGTLHVHSEQGLGTVFTIRL